MLKKLLASNCLALSIVAHAAIINFGTVTRTTAAGLDCLDETETRGLSYHQESAFGYPEINTNCDFTSPHYDIGTQHRASGYYDVALMLDTETVLRDGGAWAEASSELAAWTAYPPASSPGHGESFLVAPSPVSMPVVGWFLSALIWWVRCAYRAKHR